MACAVGQRGTLQPRSSWPIVSRHRPIASASCCCVSPHCLRASRSALAGIRCGWDSLGVAVETDIEQSLPRGHLHHFPIFSEGEYPAASDVLACVVIGRALVSQPQFLADAAKVREAPEDAKLDTASKLAKFYAQREGSPGHRTVARILLAAAAAPADWFAIVCAVEELWQEFLVRPCATRRDRATRRNRPGVRAFVAWQLASEMLARRGGGACITPGCQAKRAPVVVNGGPREGRKRAARKYCEQCYADRQQVKANAKQIEQAFAAAGRVIAVPPQHSPVDLSPSVAEPSLALAT